MVASHLFSSMGGSMGTVLALMKRLRPVICINPGFLAQLYLISVRGRDAPEIRLLTQEVSKPNLPKSEHVEWTDDASSSKLRRADYVDCYKGVILNAETKSDILGCSVDKKPGCCDTSNRGTTVYDCCLIGSDSVIGRTVALKDAHGMDDACHIEDMSEGDSKKRWTILCKSCDRVLVHEKDIVAPVDYRGFLDEHTDDYWRGYKALHPRSMDSFNLDGLTVKHADKATCGSIRHMVTRGDVAALSNAKKNTRNNNMRKIVGRPDCYRIPAAETDVCIIGPVDWVKQQLSSGELARKKSLNSAPQAGATADETLFCPQCHVECGYSRRGGLQICSTFLRCSLIALRSARVKYVQL